MADTDESAEFGLVLKEGIDFENGGGKIAICSFFRFNKMFYLCNPNNNKPF